MNPQNQSESATEFRMLGIAPAILEALDAKNITHPTPIQQKSIPPGLEGKDLIGIAQTGTGKTIAFGIPMLQRLAEQGGRGLVIVPTRELAFQVEQSLAPFASAMGMHAAVFVGGSSMHMQRKSLKRNPRILIATPGRLNDHLEQGTVTLKEVQVLVLDEADRMLDMGFKPQMNRILKHVPKQRQTLLFSATMPQEIFTLAAKEMQLPLRIEVAPAGTTATKVEQEIIIIRQEHKLTLLLSLLTELRGSILVFTRTKYGAKKVTRKLNAESIRAAEIHSNRTLPQRKEALEGFKKGKYRVLVATDIAARGIDVTDIAYVINYDLPTDPADYVHRIGRTGRAGKSGIAISFAMPSQTKDVRTIERLISAPLKRRSVSSSVPTEELERPQHKKSQGKRGKSKRTVKPRNTKRGGRNTHRQKRR